jgi:diguanylate cyclase (GGDEF)-like protein
MELLPASYDPWGVVVSILIACFASYITLELAGRVRVSDTRASRLWWAGGSVVMASGIWSMHFVGMLAFSLPIELGYGWLWTVVSWFAALSVSAIALGIASRATLEPLQLLSGAVAMGIGICAMHYTGMAALDMVPGIVWNWALVALSLAIAVAASAIALGIFFWLRKIKNNRGNLLQLLSSLVMGSAIAGMHYTGMYAAGFPVGSVCLSADGLGSQGLAGAVTLTCTVVLLFALFTSQYDKRVRRNARRMAVSLQEANENLQQANEELRRRAFIDPLTGLANRLLFEDRLHHALTRAARSNEHVSERKAERVAVLFIDLDGFKPVNDTFGHAAGDELLKQVSTRLLAELRQSDTAARVGGDEFLVLMEDVGSAADCTAMARRIGEAIARPYAYQSESLRISASIGIAMHPGSGQSEKLVANADMAMYAAKKMGGDTHALFEPRMGLEILAQQTLQEDLKNALALGQLELHFQPKVNGQLVQFSGVEALLRWNHPQRGMISPDIFIPMAERFGLIGAIGNWVIDKACQHMQEWAQSGVNMRVAINLSAHQLRDPLLVKRIQAALEHHAVDPSYLLCEITESVAMEDVKTTQLTFEGLSNLGVFLAIDDFGTGYSSLSYLRKLPARQLKIDRSFVLDLETSADARAVVDAVIRLAHALGLRVVAEGVETQGQRDILLEMRCDELQGYLFARPMPAHMLMSWVNGDRPDGTPEFTPSVLGGDLN